MARRSLSVSVSASAEALDKYAAILFRASEVDALERAIAPQSVKRGFPNDPSPSCLDPRYSIAAKTSNTFALSPEIVLGLIQRRAAEGHNETLSNAMGIIRLLISVALFAIAAIVILDNMGVNVTGLIAGLGIGGIAIGLAAQGIFSDLFASLSIIFDRPFRVGETIKYDMSTATVERIGLKSTRLRSVNGELLVENKGPCTTG